MEQGCQGEAGGEGWIGGSVGEAGGGGLDWWQCVTTKLAGCTLDAGLCSAVALVSYF